MYTLSYVFWTLNGLHFIAGFKCNGVFRGDVVVACHQSDRMHLLECAPNVLE